MNFGNAHGRIARGALALCVVLVLASAAEARSGRSAPANPDQQEKPNPDAPKADQYEAPFPTKMNWTLSEVNGKAPPAEATLTLDENFRGSGTSGCNTWSASLYPVKGHRLAMGPVAQTRKACATDLMQFERLYLGILHSGPVWEQVGYTLTVRSQGGTLTFRRGL